MQYVPVYQCQCHLLFVSTFFHGNRAEILCGLFCIYCILHAKYPITDITTPHAAMHQFPEKLNCLAIVQEFITPPPTVSCIKMTGCPLRMRRYPRDLVSPDRGGRQLRILPRHPQSPGPGADLTCYLSLSGCNN